MFVMKKIAYFRRYSKEWMIMANNDYAYFLAEQQRERQAEWEANLPCSACTAKPCDMRCDKEVRDANDV